MQRFYLFGVAYVKLYPVKTEVHTKGNTLKEILASILGGASDSLFENGKSTLLFSMIQYYSIFILFVSDIALCVISGNFRYKSPSN